MCEYCGEEEAEYQCLGRKKVLCGKCFDYEESIYGVY